MKVDVTLAGHIPFANPGHFSQTRQMLPATMPLLVRPPITLRAFERRDAGLIDSVAADPLIPLITTVPTSGSSTDVDAYLQRQRDRLDTAAGYSFAIADVETDEALGQIGLWTHEINTGRVTIGYWLAEEFRGRGYARAALHALVDWAVTLDEVERLSLFVEPWNESSWRTAEACGFAREGLLRAWEKIGEERKDMYAYSLIASDSRTRQGFEAR